MLKLFLFLCICAASDAFMEELFEKLVKECPDLNQLSSCFFKKTATALEKSIERDLTISHRIKLVRNEMKISNRLPRSRDTFLRFFMAVFNFFRAHDVRINLFEGRSSRSKGGGMFGGMNNKVMQKEKQYSRYAFLVLLGIFGLTVPLFMKTLAIIAAYSLMAAKAAFIVVGGVALKKLFEHKTEPKVKVIHVPLDDDEVEHDRFGIVYNYSPYGFKDGNIEGDNHGPYSAYYDGSETDNANYDIYRKPVKNK